MEQIEKTYLTILRDKHTDLQEFRKASDQLAGLLAHRAAALLPVTEGMVETPMGSASGLKFEEEIILVPILRAGLALLPQFQAYFPKARVGVIGIHRDESTAEPQFYYENIPDIKPEDWVILLDPMIATGGTGLSSIQCLIKHGAKPERMLFVAVITAPDGLNDIREKFPEVHIVSAANDPALNDDKFIVPGLGDYGDRFFGT